MNNDSNSQEAQQLPRKPIVLC